MSQLLHGKRVAIFGAGGSIGPAVAKTFAAGGARLFLSSRSTTKLEETARQIKASGASEVQTAAVDSLSPQEVSVYLDGLVRDYGGVDVVFNTAGPTPDRYGNGKLAVDSSFEEFCVALDEVTKPQYITAVAAARQMSKQKSGVILFQTGSPVRGHTEGASAIGTAFGAIETFSENLAFELGPSGVRVVCLRTTANVDTNVIQETLGLIAGIRGIAKADAEQALAQQNFLKRTMSVQDTAHALAFLASDRARMFTGTVVNASAGASLD